MMSEIERKKPSITDFGPCHTEIQEIEVLRQQVEYWRDTVRQELIADYEKQLAALKQSQGEPVARIVDTESALNVWWYKTPKELGIGTLLYTAPTIPEGWQLVPIDPTTKMVNAAEKIDWSDADVRGNCINLWYAMLAAAPKQEDVK